jgi:hypothetical protein
LFDILFAFLFFGRIPRFAGVGLSAPICFAPRCFASQIPLQSLARPAREGTGGTHGRTAGRPRKENGEAEESAWQGKFGMGGMDNRTAGRMEGVQRKKAARSDNAA